MIKYSDIKDDEDTAVIICNTIDMPHIAAAEVRKCDFCGADVWFAQSTMKVAGKHKKQYLICTNCAVKNIPKNEILQMPSDEQLKEVADEIGESFEVVKKRISDIIKRGNMAAKAEMN